MKNGKIYKQEGRKERKENKTSCFKKEHKEKKKGS